MVSQISHRIFAIVTDSKGMTIFTIGHSTRTIDMFIAMLTANEIKLVVDVRAFPVSRRFPQFNKETLEKHLSGQDIRYEHFPELGGRRKSNPNSKNAAWKNESFRAYADYMETGDFDLGIRRLLDLASNIGLTAIMCAEAVWWRCHRGLISDFLKVRGIVVTHIIDRGKTELHPFTSAARIVNGELNYR